MASAVMFKDRTAFINLSIWLNRSRLPLCSIRASFANMKYTMTFGTALEISNFKHILAD